MGAPPASCDGIRARPDIGFGVGLRGPHFRHILQTHPAVEWFEAITENFLDDGGWARHVLSQIAERYPVVLHGVSLSIGSTDALDMDYVRRVAALARQVRAPWVSDHLCWTGVSGDTSHDLLPLPLTEEALNHVAARISRVQDVLDQPLVLENPSSYLEFTSSSIPEAEFLVRLVERSGCQLLLDVNNVYVSSRNHGFDAVAYVDAIPAGAIAQVHLAGHTDRGDHVIDTHDDHVADAVWSLYRRLVERVGPVSTLVEWDGNIPPFEVLHQEALRARAVADGRPLPAVTRPRPARNAQHSLSTPLDFLVEVGA